MTTDEYRQALVKMSPQQLAAFRENFGGPVTLDVDELVQEFVYADDYERWDRTLVFRLRQAGVMNVRTEQEKLGDRMQQSADGAAASAVAAQESAEAAKRSVRIGWYSVVAAVLAIVVTLTLKHC